MITHRSASSSSASQLCSPHLLHQCFFIHSNLYIMILNPFSSSASAPHGKGKSNKRTIPATDTNLLNLIDLLPLDRQDRLLLMSKPLHHPTSFRCTSGVQLLAMPQELLCTLASFNSRLWPAPSATQSTFSSLQGKKKHALSEIFFRERAKPSGNESRASVKSYVYC